MKRAISISVNGVAQQHEVEPRLLLVHYLRDVLGLTGTHVGCETSLRILHARDDRGCRSITRSQLAANSR